MLLDTYAPIQKLTKAESKLKSKPWLTRGIMTSIKKKNIIYKKFIKAKNSTEKNILYNEFKRYRNLVTKLSRISKAKHYHHYFTDHKKNMLKTWEGIKLLVNINKRNNKTVNCLNVDGVEETDPFVISNHFNKFFSTIAQQIEGKIVKTNKHFSDFLSEPLQSNFFLTPTLPDEIQEIIKSLNSKKATGPNSIPTKILKVFSKTISIPLANLINLSFECGIFPMSLKVASVTPIHEKGGSLDCNNYRPVSLISNLSKLIEKLVHNRLYNFLEKHKLLYEHQYGFQKKHSTNHALIDITEKIRSALDQNIFACGVFIDLQKAFDTVNHDILLHKLDHYGIRGLPNKWFQSFLSGRSQYTTIKDKSSNKLPTTHGVPQLSVLGPLLFILYINNLNKAIIHSYVHHFADDTNLLYCNKS